MARTKAPKKSAPIVGDNDLSTLAMRQTAIVTLYHPGYPGQKRDTGYRVEIEPMYSATAREAAELARTKLAIADGDVEAEERSWGSTVPEQTIAVTRRWWKEGESTDTITLNGEVLEATPENVRRVYESPEFSWMQRAVQKAYLDFANFFGAPKTD